MVTDLELIDNKGVWRFSLTVYCLGRELKLKGWRYWEESHCIKPSSYFAHKKSFPLAIFGEGAYNEILNCVESSLESLRSSRKNETSIVEPRAESPRNRTDDMLRGSIQFFQKKQMTLESLKESFVNGTVTKAVLQRFFELCLEDGGFGEQRVNVEGFLEELK